MHFDFRPVLRRTFAKIPLSADPSHQQGAHQRNRKHQVPWRLALAKPHFWKLGCWIWSLLLETSETLGSTSKRCKDVLQDHGIWLWRTLTFGSLAASCEGKGKCAVPLSCRTPGPRVAGGGSPEQAVMYTMIMIRNIQLSRDFRKENILFRELRKNFREGF